MLTLCKYRLHVSVHGFAQSLWRLVAIICNIATGCLPVVIKPSCVIKASSVCRVRTCLRNVRLRPLNSTRSPPCIFISISLDSFSSHIVFVFGRIMFLHFYIDCIPLSQFDHAWHAYRIRRRIPPAACTEPAPACCPPRQGSE
jgi:hypothetical protein